jgi:hypothetical protein
MQKTIVNKPDFFDRLFWRFVASLQMERAFSVRPIFIAFLIVFFFAALLALSPSVLIADYTYDSFIALDSALRSLDGQWPHLDFYTPLGDLYYLILGITARIFGFAPKILLWEQILTVPVVLWATAIATRNRLPASLRGILIVMVGLLCISPGDLDDPSSLSFLASYNRDGWVLMMPVLAAALLEPLRGRHTGWIGQAILLFCLIMALFYLKITFALVAVLTLFCAIVWVPQNRRSCMAALLLLGITIAIISASGPLMAAYFDDLHRASLASPLFMDASDPFRLIKLKLVLESQWFVLIAPICFAIWLGRSSHSDEERSTGNRILLVCMIASGGNIGLSWQNHENAMPSQIIAMAIVFAAMWNRQLYREQDIPLSDRRHPSSWSPVILAGLFMLFIAATNIIGNGRSIILHTVKTTAHLVQPVSTTSPYVQGLTVPVDNKPGAIGDVLSGKIDPALYSAKSRVSWHNDLATVFDDGWRLYQANKPQQPRIVTLVSAPVMTVITGTAPPRHMAAWMDMDRTVSTKAPIMPERDFADVNVVMVLKIQDDNELFDMVRDYLAHNFHVAGETPIWQMWVRNDK